MALRYHSAAGAIQAAGAAFACSEDDLSMPRQGKRSRSFASLYALTILFFLIV